MGKDMTGEHDISSSLLVYDYPGSCLAEKIIKGFNACLRCHSCNVGSRFNAEYIHTCFFEILQDCAVIACYLDNPRIFIKAETFLKTIGKIPAMSMHHVRCSREINVMFKQGIRWHYIFYLNKTALVAEEDIKGILRLFYRFQIFFHKKTICQCHCAEIKKLEYIFFTAESAIHALPSKAEYSSICFRHTLFIS